MVVIAIGVAVGLDLNATHQALTRSEEARLTHAADVIESTLHSRLRAAANALDVIGPELLALQAGRTTPAIVNQQLSAMVSSMIGVRTLVVVDADGTAIASNRPLLLGMNFHDDARYRTIRGDGDPKKLFLSPPFVTPHGVYTITAGKAVVDVRGHFAGYTIAAIDPDFFSELLRASSYAPDMRAMLVHGDGKIVIHVPDDGQFAGTDLLAKPDSLFSRYVASGQRGLITSGRTGNSTGDRLAALRTITHDELSADKPLVVALSRQVNAIYAPWRKEALVRGSLVAALALIGIFSLWSYQRRQTASEALLATEEAERARLEQALQTDRQYLAEVIWGTDAGTWEFNVKSGAVRFNERWATLLGYTLDELSPVTFDTWRRLTHPDDQVKIAKLSEGMIAGKIDSFEAKIRMLHKSGDWVWILDRGRVVERDDEGAAVRIAGAHLDISEAQAAELRTEAALRYARNLLESSLDPIMAIALDGRITDVNEAAETLTGHRRDELIGREFAECFTNGVQARDICRRVFSIGRVRDYPLTLRHVDGSQTEVLYNASVFRDEHEQIAGAITVARDITQLRQYQHELEQANAEARLLGRMSDMLQSCQTLDESVPIVQASLLQLFPSSQGRLFLTDDAGAQLHEAACWGGLERQHASILPINCWALRRNHVHDVGFENRLNPPCHQLSGETRPYLCLPLHAQGQPLGIIHLVFDESHEARHRSRQLAQTAADSIGLSLANLRLRESLQALSLRDPLTGLYNRRFMEEALAREISRATRAGKPLTVAMLDLDHFKHFNDNHGHDAGDAVLQAFAQLLTGFRQGSDLACRYGGEEFLMILPGADAEHAASRLEDLRQALARLNVAHGGSALPAITVSIGLAGCVAHRLRSAELIKAADEALYRAKELGRNRIEIAPAPQPPSP